MVQMTSNLVHWCMIAGQEVVQRVGGPHGAPSNGGQAGPPGQSFAWLLKPGFDKLEQFNKEKTATIFMI